MLRLHALQHSLGVIALLGRMSLLCKIKLRDNEDKPKVLKYCRIGTTSVIYKKLSVYVVNEKGQYRILWHFVQCNLVKVGFFVIDCL